MDAERGAFVVTDSPLGRVVRQIMASGLMCGLDHMRDAAGVDPDAPVGDVLGGFPDAFLTMRPNLVDDLRAALADTP